jgi:uncharacterized protein
MPYKFTFDLSNAPRYFFTELSTISNQTKMPKKIIVMLQFLLKKFKIEEVTGLNINDALMLMEDFIELQASNRVQRIRFLETKRRALFLSHCSRKFLDNRCKAHFDASIPTYVCAHCSSDCLINQSVELAQSKGYDVFVLPGGSCIPNILKTRKYEGLIGVACGEEVKAFNPLLNSMNIRWQGVPLLKNGCANTFFSMETLSKTL